MGVSSPVAPPPVQVCSKETQVLPCVAGRGLVGEEAGPCARMSVG